MRELGAAAAGAADTHALPSLDFKIHSNNLMFQSRTVPL